MTVAYGMPSWLPNRAREALLHVVARALAPGAAATEAPGQLLRLEQARQPGGPGGAIGRGPAEALRRLGAGMTPALAGPPMAGALHSTLGQNPGQLTADGLNPDRRAFYLMEVLDAAAQSGLAYMGDASLTPDWVAGGPASPAPTLGGLTHLVALHHRDCLLHMDFRRSLFVRAQDAEPLRTEPDPEAALSLHAALATPLAAGVRPFTDRPGEDGDALLAAINTARHAAPLSAVHARSDLPARSDTARWGMAALRRAASNRIAPQPRAAATAGHGASRASDAAVRGRRPPTGMKTSRCAAAGGRPERKEERSRSRASRAPPTLSLSAMPRL